MPTTKDVVDLLVEQHAHIEELFTKVGQARSAATRLHAFEELRRFLAVHETAEELITHPTARMSEGNDVVDARLREEDALKEMLVELDHMDLDDDHFPEKLLELKTAVRAHAEAEELEEFPLLREGQDQARLDRMARAVNAVEAIAPTHPHPRAGSSMTMNLMVGPLASVIDRTRDAVTKALRD